MNAEAPGSVLVVTYEYPPLGGGGGVIFRDLAEELARSMDVTVLTSGRAGLPREERDGRLEIFRTPVALRNANATASLPSMLSFFPSSLMAGRKLLQRRRYDVVHSSFAVPSGPAGVLIARRAGVPHLLSLHGGDVYDPSKRLSPHRTPLLRDVVRWVMNASDRVVAQSSDTRARAMSIYGQKEVDIVPLAFHKPRFKPLSRAELGLDLKDNAFLLVTVGRLVARKGLPELFDIVRELGDSRFQLVVIGEGPERENLEEHARSAGIAERVRFTGFVSDERKWQILENADLYVSTSLHEGFGIVFLEAMESGLPVQCYDRGGQVDFVTNEVGRILPLGDVKRFRDEILFLSRNAEARRSLSDAARGVAAEYSIARYAESYRALYTQCMVNANRNSD